LRVHRSWHVPLDQLTDLEPGPKTPDHPAGCRIEHNLMHDLGVFGKQVAGVYISAAEGIRVRHNTICRVPRAAICFNDGCWGGHLVEFNDLFLTVLETSDHGPINAWGRDRFWQSPHREGKECDMSLSRKFARLDSHMPTLIRNNRLRHEVGFSWGIDLDDGASNYVVENNLCIGCSVKLREGYFREVRNNIFIGGNPPNKHCCFEGSDDVYVNNIHVNTRDAWALNRGPSTSVLPIEIDRNVYWNTVGEAPLFGFRGLPGEGGEAGPRKLSFEQWRALGADPNSVFADPGFRDIQAGDYRLGDDSPALEAGFRPFPLDRFGTAVPMLRELADRLRSSPGGPGGDVPDHAWMGMLIRDDEAGVLVRAVPPASAGHRAGFRDGDLLLRMNDAPTTSVAALTGIISGAPIDTTEFRVRRGGRERVIVTDGPGGVPSAKTPQPDEPETTRQ
jgi:hypothetical protein